MSARQMWAAVAVMFAVAIALVIYIVDSAGAQTVDVQIEPDVTVIEPAHQVPVPPVTCTDGTYTFTAGVGPQDFVRILIADELDAGVSCSLPHPVTAGGYREGDVVFRDGIADRPRLWVCQALFADVGTQRDCMGITVCETRTLERAVRREPSDSGDYGPFQHSWKYIDGRFAAIGHPDGDRYDLWLGGLAARYLYEQSGGSWRYWSCARAVKAA